MLPSKNWQVYDDIIKALGEQEETLISDELDFLEEIGMITSSTSPELTDDGDAYFQARFIQNDKTAGIEILKTLLLKYRPVEALVQLLWGVRAASKENALTILKSRGFWDCSGSAPLTHLLVLLNQVGIVTYSRKTGSLKINVNPNLEETKSPPNIFVDPDKPYSNLMWLRRILSDCKGYIYWLDKHFYKEGLEQIWEVADGERINEVKIISLELKDNLTKNAKKEYKKLQAELAKRDISLEWYVIDSKDIRDDHDRWIIGDGSLRNVPNVHAILNGQRSELNESSNHDEMIKVFRDYLAKSKLVA